MTLSKRVDGVAQRARRAAAFEVARLREGALPGVAPEQAAAFYRRFAEVERAVRGASKALADARARVKLMRQALDKSRVDPGGDLDAGVRDLERRLTDLAVALDGGGARAAIGEPVVPSVARRLDVAQAGDGEARPTGRPRPTAAASSWRRRASPRCGRAWRRSSSASSPTSSPPRGGRGAVDAGAGSAGGERPRLTPSDLDLDLA